MTATAPATLQDLGPLILGNHTLDLEQKIILRCAADRAVQENDFRTCTTKFVDQKHLMGITACQPIRGMDINALDMAAGNCVPQPLQGRTRQDRTTVAFIHVAVIRFELEVLGSDTLS